jgi:nucleoside-diphosphate-sugar epimerase
MRTIVTGSAGFIGGHLARRLKAEGHAVLGVDNRPGDQTDWLVDLSTQSPEGLLDRLGRADLVMHAACYFGGAGFIHDPKEHASMFSVNMRMNLNVVEYACEVSARTLFTSTACVYPWKLQLHGSDDLREEQAIPADPEGPYGWHKLATEEILHAYGRSRGLDYVIARLFNIYGPGEYLQDPKAKATGALARKVAARENPLVIWGDGSARRAFLYIDDCVEALLGLAMSGLRDVFNVGNPQPITINELVARLCSLANFAPQVQHDMSKPVGVQARCPNIEKIEKAIGWFPRTALDVGLLRLYQDASSRLVASPSRAGRSLFFDRVMGSQCCISSH